MRRKLKVIGGLGDHHMAILLGLPSWRRHGFEPKLVPFRWQEPKGDFDSRFESLLEQLDPNDNIIGFSAGGVVAALALLERPDVVRRAVAVASPLNRQTSRKNLHLNAGLARLSMRLLNVSPDLLSRIASFRGRADGTVSPSASWLRGGYNKELPCWGHLATIAAATSLHSGQIARWLHSD